MLEECMRLKNNSWDKIKLFYYVATHKNITSAANFLNVSQPALSRSIQILEHTLKTKLFQRIPRGLILTKDGEILFETAKRIVLELSHADMMLNDSDIPRGTLKITTTTALANLWLIEYIPGFLKMYPEMKLTILGNDQELDLTVRQADVAIRPAMLHQPDLIQKYLMTWHLKLYASSSYLKEFGVPKSPEDLNYHHLITFADEDSTSPYGNINWLLRLDAPLNQLREPYLSINSTQGLRRAAEAGLGIAAISEEYPGLKESNLIQVLPDIKGPEIDIYYVYPGQLKHSKRVTVFGEYLLNALKK
jgi:DNA-binding transcriptional LysR family regulator